MIYTFSQSESILHIMSTIAEPFRVHLPQFEGPFDLLLFFIERDELNIYDIPISKVTQDFLAYIHSMQSLNIEIAAEFILVASSLMRIKAKMLLPRPVLDENNEEIDPREELVRRLLEYKKYKSALDDLQRLEELQATRHNRAFASVEIKEFSNQELPEDELIGISLFTIMKTFKRIWERHQDNLEPPKHVIKKYPFTIAELKESLIDRLSRERKLDFSHIISERNDKIYVVFCFLAILELVQYQKVSLTIGTGYNNFWIEKPVE